MLHAGRGFIVNNHIVTNQIAIQRTIFGSILRGSTISSKPDDGCRNILCERLLSFRALLLIRPEPVLSVSRALDGPVLSWSNRICRPMTRVTAERRQNGFGVPLLPVHCFSVKAAVGPRYYVRRSSMVLPPANSHEVGLTM